MKERRGKEKSRETAVRMAYYSARGGWWGGCVCVCGGVWRVGGVSVTEAGTDESSAQSSSRHMTQLITAQHPRKEAASSSSSSSCIFKHAVVHTSANYNWRLCL